MKKLFMVFPLVLSLCLTFGCQKQAEEGITEEEAQTFTDHILKMWNEVDLTIVDKVYSPDIVRHDCGVPEDIVGLEHAKNHLGNLFNNQTDAGQIQPHAAIFHRDDGRVEPQPVKLLL